MTALELLRFKPVSTVPPPVDAAMRRLSRSMIRHPQITENPSPSSWLVNATVPSLPLPPASPPPLSPSPAGPPPAHPLPPAAPSVGAITINFLLYFTLFVLAAQIVWLLGRLAPLALRLGMLCTECLRWLRQGNKQPTAHAMRTMSMTPSAKLPQRKGNLVSAAKAALRREALGIGLLDSELFYEGSGIDACTCATCEGLPQSQSLPRPAASAAPASLKSSVSNLITEPSCDHPGPSLSRRARAGLSTRLVETTRHFASTRAWPPSPPMRRSLDPRIATPPLSQRIRGFQQRLIVTLPITSWRSDSRSTSSSRMQQHDVLSTAAGPILV